MSPLDLPFPFLHLGEATIGPTVAVVANVHGDESLGTAIIAGLRAHLAQRPLHGRLLLVPSANPIGLREGRRSFGPENEDLNRCFPGDVRGSPAERQAFALWTLLLDSRPSCVLDLHADCPAAIPHAILDPVIQPKGETARALVRRIQGLGLASGLTMAWDHEPEDYVRHRYDRSLTGALVNVARLPALTIEAGPRRFVDPQAVEAGIHVVLSILAHEGLLAQRVGPHPTRLSTTCWTRVPGPRAAREGLLRPLLGPGVRVRAGDAVAEVLGYDGLPVETLHARETGYILALHDGSWVRPGTPCLALAVGGAGGVA